jgi:hypothetical protein
MKPVSFPSRLTACHHRAWYKLPTFYESLPVIREGVAGDLFKGDIPIACSCEDLYRLGRLRERPAVVFGADTSHSVEETLAAYRVVVVAAAIFEDEARQVFACMTLQAPYPATHEAVHSDLPLPSNQGVSTP